MCETCDDRWATEMNIHLVCICSKGEILNRTKTYVSDRFQAFLSMAHSNHKTMSSSADMVDNDRLTCPPLWLWHPNLPTFVDMAYKPAHLCGCGTRTCPPLPLWHTILPTSANMEPKTAHLCEYGTQTCPPLRIWHTNLPKAQKTRQ
jgi:hypothetical protein